MASDWQDPDADDEDTEGYFSEVLADAELTGLEPKFKFIDSMTTAPADMASMKVDDLISMYIKARNQLATDRKGYKSREASVKLHMSIISMTLRDKGDMLGVDSFKSAFGTAYRNIKETFRVSTWDDLVSYVKQTGNFQVLQKRVSPNAIKEIRTVDGAIPPGVEPHVEIEFAVRSPTARKK